MPPSWILRPQYSCQNFLSTKVYHVNVANSINPPSFLTPSGIFIVNYVAIAWYTVDAKSAIGRPSARLFPNYERYFFRGRRRRRKVGDRGVAESQQNSTATDVSYRRDVSNVRFYFTISFEDNIRTTTSCLHAIHQRRRKENFIAMTRRR